MNAALNIGLIGCGRAAERLYLPTLSRLAEAQLVAVADPIRERRELISSNIPNCLAFSTAEALLKKAKIAAVIITTPPTTHVYIATLALCAGIPVLVEKPLAPSMAGVEALEALVASSTGSVMVGFNRRHWEPVRKLRQIMCNRHHSDAISTQLIMTSNVQAWSPICGASDPLEDLGSHQFDLLRYIFDREILAVNAHWTNTHTIRMRVRLAGGGVAHCLAAHSNIYQESITVQCGRKRYQIHKGAERIEPTTGLVRSVLNLSDALRRRLRGQRSSLKRSYERQLISFLNYVRTGTTPQPSIADGIAAIRAVEAARQSAHIGGMEISI